MGKKRKKHGPKPNHLIIDGKWEEAIKKAVKKKQPQDSWPKKQRKTVNLNENEVFVIKQAIWGLCVKYILPFSFGFPPSRG